MKQLMSFFRFVGQKVFAGLTGSMDFDCVSGRRFGASEGQLKAKLLFFFFLPFCYRTNHLGEFITSWSEHQNK